MARSGWRTINLHIIEGDHTRNPHPKLPSHTNFVACNRIADCT